MARKQKGDPPSRVTGISEPCFHKAVPCRMLYCSQRPFSCRDKSIDAGKGRSANHIRTDFGLHFIRVGSTNRIITY